MRAQINDEIKEEVTAVLAEIGLTISDAFQILLIRVAREKVLLFEPFILNAKAIASIEAARKGDLVTIGSIDNFDMATDFWTIFHAHFCNCSYFTSDR